MSELEPAEIIIGREDWELFLSSLERLMTMQEKLVNQHREVLTRNEALRKELEGPLKAPLPTEPLPVIEKNNEHFAVRHFTDRILNWLNPPAPPGADRSRTQTGPNMQPLQFHGMQTPRIDANQAFFQNYRCGNCGREITKPSNFCERCGVVFGGLYCRCGTLLAPEDKFCYKCGQPVL